MVKSLVSLRVEKRRLLRLVKKQAIVRGKIRRAREEEEKLRAEVKQLERIAAKKFQKKRGILSKMVAKTRSPETKERLQKAKGKLRRGWAAFQKFADKYGEKL